MHLRLGGFFANDEIRVNILDASELFWHGCAKGKEVVKRGRKAIFVIILDFVNVGKKSVVRDVSVVKRDKAVFENLDTNIHSGGEFDVFFSLDAVFNAADLEIFAVLVELLLVELGFDLASAQKVINFRELQHGSLEPPADVNIVDFHERLPDYVLMFLL